MEGHGFSRTEKESIRTRFSVPGAVAKPPSYACNFSGLLPGTPTAMQNIFESYRFVACLLCFDGKQFNIEDQRRVGTNHTAGAVRSIGKVRWQDKLPL